MYSAMDSLVVHLMQSGDFDEELRELMDHEGYDISRFHEMIKIVQTTPREDMFAALLPMTTKAMPPSKRLATLAKSSPPPKSQATHSKSSPPWRTDREKVAITPKAPLPRA